MKVTYHAKPIALVLMIASLCIGSSSVWAADAAPAKTATPAKEAAPPSKEMREKMALAHEKMAACLRSDHSIADCRQEMMKGCQEMGEHACGMMGERHKMMMHGEGPAGAPPAKP
jgi:hypothetical protein